MDSLTCLHCGTTQPLHNFHTDKRTVSGYKQPCKACALLRSHMGFAAYALYRRTRLAPATRVCPSCHIDKLLEAFPSTWQLCEDCGALARAAKKATAPPPVLLRCNVCLTDKPLEAFPTHRTSKYGHCQPCTACKNLRRSAAFSEANKQRFALEYARRREHFLAKSARQRRKNPEKVHAAEANWRRQHPEKVAANKARRRAQEHGAPFVEHVDLDVLFKRDRGICQLCHTRCAREDATRDHIIPVSQGGAHSYANCVLAHGRCNSQKKDRVVTQQMRLF